MSDVEVDVEDDFVVCCDGAWLKEQRKAGLGVVIIRGNTVVGCIVNGVRGCTTVKPAEIKALPEAMNKAIFCSDSAADTKAFQGDNIHDNGYIEELKEGMKFLKYRSTWRISHVFREANTLADGLAKIAASTDWSWTNLNALPTVLSDFRKEML